MEPPIFIDLPGHIIVEGVTALHADDMGMDGAQQVNVPDHVQDLVPDQFIREPGGGQDLVLAEHHYRK